MEGVPQLTSPRATKYTEYSVTITTASFPLSSYSGCFSITFHPPSGESETFDLDGRFPTGSIVRFHLAYPEDQAIFAVSIQARQSTMSPRWRISRIHLLADDIKPAMELVAGPLTVPCHKDTPLPILLRRIAPLPRSPTPSGSAIIHIWLPTWSLALRSPAACAERDTLGVSTVSSEATLVPSEDARGFAFNPARTYGKRVNSDSMKSITTSSTYTPSSCSQPSSPSSPRSPIIAPPTRYASWGHASLSYFDPMDPEADGYISFWPTELSPSTRLPRSLQHLRKLRCKARWSRSLREDVIEEAREPDVTLRIPALDVEAVRAWVDAEVARGRKYTPWNRNCAEVVWQAVCAGLAGGSEDPTGRLRARIVEWEDEPWIREPTSRSEAKKAEGFPARMAEVTGTKVPADLEGLIERMQAMGYGV